MSVGDVMVNPSKLSKKLKRTHVHENNEVSSIEEKKKQVNSYFHEEKARKSTAVAFLNGESKKKRDSSLAQLSDDCGVHKKKHKHKSNTKDSSSSNIVDYEEPSISSSLMSTGERKRKKKKKKKKKERETDAASSFRTDLEKDATINEDDCSDFEISTSAHQDFDLNKVSLNTERIFEGVGLHDFNQKHNTKLQENRTLNGSGCIASSSSIFEGVGLHDFNQKHNTKLQENRTLNGSGCIASSSSVLNLSSSGEEKRKHKKKKRKKEKERERNVVANNGTALKKDASSQHKNAKRKKVENFSNDNVSHETLSPQGMTKHNKPSTITERGPEGSNVLHKMKQKLNAKSQGHRTSDHPGAIMSPESDNSMLLSDEERSHRERKEKKTNIRWAQVGPNAKMFANCCYTQEQIDSLVWAADQIHESWIITDKRHEELKAMGIHLRKGIWSMKELNLLKSNMNEFLEEHNLSDPLELLFFHRFMEGDDLKYWKNFVSKTNFYTHLGRGIQRNLLSVLRCACRIYDETNYLGSYTDEETKELKRLFNIHGPDWVTVGQAMGRSNTSVCRKYYKTVMEDINKGSWADDETDRLKEAVYRVTDTPEGESAPFKGFSWQAVADIVKTRSSYQCQSQWLYRLCFTEDKMRSGKRWSAEDDRKLITRLYTSGVTEECDVDWMDVKSEFDINYSPQWCCFKWSEIKKRVPDYHLLDFEDALDYLYQKYGKTARDSE